MRLHRKKASGKNAGSLDFSMELAVGLEPTTCAFRIVLTGILYLFFADNQHYSLSKNLEFTPILQISNAEHHMNL